MFSKKKSWLKILTSLASDANITTQSPSGEMVDAGDLKSPSLRSAGSSPASGTKFYFSLV